MAVIRVGAYQVGANSSIDRDWDRMDSAQLRLWPHVSYSGSLKQVVLPFYRDLVNPSVIPNETIQVLVAVLDFKYFDLFYHVLQTEEPTYFDWVEGLYFRLMTSEELPGEGHAEMPHLYSLTD